MLVHGGDIAGYRERYGRLPLDFSANISPLGLPEGVKKAVTAALDSADRYPDPLCRELTCAIALHESVPQEQIICGNGAADLIFRLALALHPRKALLPAPTFAEYEQALGLVGCQIQHHVLQAEQDFMLTEAILEDITPELDMLFLCQPNNPTGQPCPPRLLHRIADACADNGVVLVTDECFVDFLEDARDYSLSGRLYQKNIVILKAFTKQYAMAGIRLGYCLCGDAQLVQTMRGCGQPWAVSSLAQAAGVAALRETEYLQRLLALVAVERRWLAERMTELGCRCIGSQANYIFLESAAGLTERLEQVGILIRSCQNYIGLSERYYRVAVRERHDNEQLVAAMQEVLQ